MVTLIQVHLKASVSFVTPRRLPYPESMLASAREEAPVDVQGTSFFDRQPPIQFILESILLQTQHHCYSLSLLTCTKR